MNRDFSLLSGLLCLVTKLLERLLNQVFIGLLSVISDINLLFISISFNLFTPLTKRRLFLTLASQFAQCICGVVVKITVLRSFADAIMATMRSIIVENCFLHNRLLFCLFIDCLILLIPNENYMRFPRLSLMPTYPLRLVLDHIS